MMSSSPKKQITSDYLINTAQRFVLTYLFSKEKTLSSRMKSKKFPQEKTEQIKTLLNPIWFTGSHKFNLWYKQHESKHEFSGEAHFHNAEEIMVESFENLKEGYNT